ncbi:glycosyltransferase family 2 protein [Shumkonia mesophila]|uniref:glycosyltransferase family 2 protein n=1 Tax=Shumkonia mesophila TaxID=2838854 RepID=UPI002934C9BC|nr:glycosyltransferase [Shumkonia mesophila]
MVFHDSETGGTGVSFVITVYNKSACLPAVIGALQRQEGSFDREFIFVDDGSTDDSAAVIEREAADLRNVSIVRQPNAGPSWAINAGLARARFPYVKGLDGDDLLTPRATSLLLDAVRTTGCPMAYGTCLPFPPGQDPLTVQHGALEGAPPAAVRVERPLERLMDGYLFGNASAWLASRALLLAAGGSDPKVFIQDVSIMLRMAARTPFATLDYPVFFWPREADGRLTGSELQILHDINRAFADFFAEHPEIPAVMRRRAAKRLTGRAWKWARRRCGAGMASADFWRYIRGLLAIGDPVALMEESCRSFVGAIRTPPKNRAAPILPAR